MGFLTYGGVVVGFDDRTLTHLQVVIMQKFRRGDAFPLSWRNDPSIGEGRSALWLTPAVPILFDFAGSRVPSIDPDWIDRLRQSAESPRGLVVTDAFGHLINGSTGDGRRHAVPGRAVR